MSEARFEEWLLAERERFRELAVEALAKLLAHRTQAGATERAIQTATRLLGLDPLQEVVHRALMRLYARQGRRGAALKQYQVCVSVLQRELATDPEPETQALYREMLRRLPEDAPYHAGRTPPPPAHETPLIGRQAVLDELTQTLEDALRRQPGVVLVAGEAGVGKSRVVGELGARGQALGGRVLVGRCYETEQILPFGPWVDALRRAGLTAEDEALRELDPVARGELTRLFPELGPAPEELTAPDNPRPLFDGLGALLARLTERCARLAERSRRRPTTSRTLSGTAIASPVTTMVPSWSARSVSSATNGLPSLAAHTCRPSRATAAASLPFRAAARTRASTSASVSGGSVSDTNRGAPRNSSSARWSSGTASVASSRTVTATRMGALASRRLSQARNARCLEALGHEVVVADPNFAPMYASRTRKVKTDRRDARALADACVLGAYRRAHRLSDPQRHVRGRLLVRDALVRTRTRHISVARALLRQQGYRVPSGSAEAFPTRVRTLALPGPLLSLIAPLLAVMRHLNRQLAYSDATIERVAAHDERVQRLRTVPSVGPVTAAAFVATVDDVQRFRHAHQLEAYLGLVPREHSSGDTQRRGPITKAGSSRMRWLLIQAAVSILRRRPPETEALRLWALHIAARRGKHVAVVALARRLAGILYALLRDGTVFTPRRAQPVTTLPISANV